MIKRRFIFVGEDEEIILTPEMEEELSNGIEGDEQE